MTIAERIDCMECGSHAYLVQPVGPEDDVVEGDVLTYLCSACAQRWDVVVDAEDLVEDD